ncbi:unnamed protein product, partial [Laminaria digitata]
PPRSPPLQLGGALGLTTTSPARARHPWPTYLQRVASSLPEALHLAGEGSTTQRSTTLTLFRSSTTVAARTAAGVTGLQRTPPPPEECRPTLPLPTRPLPVERWLEEGTASTTGVFTERRWGRRLSLWERHRGFLPPPFFPVNTPNLGRRRIRQQRLLQQWRLLHPDPRARPPTTCSTTATTAAARCSARTWARMVSGGGGTLPS